MRVKRYEWVACDEHSCHCDVVESAEGDMVDYDDYAALEARCTALAGENAGLKEYLAPVELAVEGTPATDAFLAEVRAQGVEMLREHPAIKLCSLTHVCDEFAAQLRKGGATEEKQSFLSDEDCHAFVKAFTKGSAQ